MANIAKSAQSKNVIRNGGQILAEAIRLNGVDCVFGLHGGHLDSFLYGIVDEGMRFIDVRHEAAAVHAADGYSRSSGRLGVSVVTSGPGVTNAITGAAVANVDSIPQLIVGGAPPIRDEGKFVLQGGVDQVALMKPVTKQALRVSDIRRIPEYVDLAIRTATRGRPGPVYLEVPIDVLFDRIQESKVPKFPAVATLQGSRPSNSLIHKVINSLQHAQRPVIICGNGVFFDDAQNCLREFAERFRVPVFGNSRALGILPHSHELYGGLVSGLNALDDKPDWILLLGGRASQMTLGTRGSSFVSEDADLFQVDVNPEEIGRNFPITDSFVGSIKAFLEEALEVGGQNQPSVSSDWLKSTRAQNFAHDVFEEEALSHTGDLHPYWFGREITDAAPKDSIFVADGSETYHWVEPIAKLDKPGHWLGHGYFGCLGIGHPYAIGAKIANPDKTVIQVVGDGSTGFNIQEFDTMVRHDIPVITFINTNQSWGISAHGQDALTNRRVGTDLPITRYEDVMKSFGGHGEIVRHRDEIAPALQRSIDSGLPSVINVLTDPAIESPRVRKMMKGIRENAGLDDADAQTEKPIAIPYYDPIER